MRTIAEIHAIERRMLANLMAGRPECEGLSPDEVCEQREEVAVQNMFGVPQVPLEDPTPRHARASVAGPIEVAYEVGPGGAAMKFSRSIRCF
jgi:hypothetical protein